MRIGINTLFEHPEHGTGGLTYLKNLIRKLPEVDQRNRYILFVSPRNQHLFRSDHRNVEYALCPFSNERRVLRTLFEHTLLPVKVRQQCLDILHSPGNIVPLVVPCCSVVTIHTLHHYRTPEMIGFSSGVYRRLLMKRTAAKADRIIAASGYVKDELHAILGTPKNKMIVVWDGVEASDYKSQTSSLPSSQGKYILFISALLPYKNAEALLRAFRLLLDKYHLEGYSVVIIGGGWSSYRAKLEQEVVELGLRGQVKFTGRVPEVKSWYQGASVFVYPSRQEEFGLPVLEAMASGIPVVASNRGSLPEVAGNAASLVDPDDIQGMADCIYRLLFDEALRLERIQRGFARVQEFSWERTAQETIRVYEEAFSSWNCQRCF